MRTVLVSDVMNRATIAKDEIVKARISEDAFLRYTIRQQPVVLVVSATHFLKALLGLWPDQQESVVHVLMGLVPEIGEHVVVLDELDNDENKTRRGVQVMRAKPQPDGITATLLITR